MVHPLKLFVLLRMSMISCTRSKTSGSMMAGWECSCKVNKLIAVGAAILVAGIAADNVNLWLKQVASRPRYKYLITLDDPKSQFRNWWQMVPNLAGSDDSFKSWPSGNMTIASMMFSLPMLADATKKRSEGRNLRCFIAACAFVLLYGYNRIHMTNHFLTDVCFGTLITYLIYSAVSAAFMQGLIRNN